MSRGEGAMECKVEFARPRLAGVLGAVWQQFRGEGLLGAWRRRPPRQLRLCETLSLGERRFLAVVQFEQQRFLVGGTSSSLALLAQLPAPPAGQPSLGEQK